MGELQSVELGADLEGHGRRGYSCLLQAHLWEGWRSAAVAIQVHRTSYSDPNHCRLLKVVWEVVVGVCSEDFVNADLGELGPPYSCLTDVVG